MSSTQQITVGGLTVKQKELMIMLVHAGVTDLEGLPLADIIMLQSTSKSYVNTVLRRIIALMSRGILKAEYYSKARRIYIKFTELGYKYAKSLTE